MDKTPVTDRIRALEPNSSVFLKGYSASSIRAIVSRLRKAFKGKRKFYTESARDGVSVWRLM